MGIWIMANISINTTAPAYNTRRQQFTDIVSFYGPVLGAYLKESPERQTAMRQHDIFLRDILEFIRKFNDHDTEGLLG